MTLLVMALFLTMGDAGVNTLKSNRDVGKPMLDAQDELIFNWYDIKADSVKFSITFDTQFIETIPGEEDGVIDFDPANDLLFFYDQNANSEFKMAESIAVGEQNNGFGLEYLGTDDTNHNVGIDTQTYTYEITGIDSNTEYSGFALYFKTDASYISINEPSQGYGGDFEIYHPGINDDRYDENGYIDANHTIIFEDDWVAASFKTPRSDEYFTIIIWLIVALILLILLILLIIYLVIWWRRHISLSLYFDSSKSIDEGELVINLLHVNRHPKYWHAHEDDLMLFAAGRAIDCIFTKSPEVRGGYRVYITDDTGSKKVMLSIMSATRYNNWYLGVKGHQETLHAYAISDSRAKRITKMISATMTEINEETRETMLGEIVSKTDKAFGKLKENNQGIISHISDNRSTSTSLRYQVMYPEHHVLYNSFEHDQNDVDDPQKKTFYYIYDGKAYEIEHKFVGKYGHLYEYDLINLEPGTIYPGLSVSLDGGKTIAPSAALYGITKTEDGVFPTKDHAKLAKPKKTTKTHTLWTIREARAYLGDDIMHRTFDILTMSHYEDENPGKLLNPDKAKSYYDEYIDRWFVEDDGKYDISKDWDPMKIIPIGKVQPSMMTTAEKLAGRAFSPRYNGTEKKASTTKSTTSKAKATAAKSTENKTTTATKKTDAKKTTTDKKSDDKEKKV